VAFVSRVGAAAPTRAAAATASLHSFAGAMRCFATNHSLAVRAIADAKDAFRASVATGACPALERVSLGFGLTEVQLYSRPGM
jgi:hypothetical protein